MATLRQNDDCVLLLVGRIPPTEEIVRHFHFADRSLHSGKTARTIHYLSIYLFLLSILCSFLSVYICHLISLMFSQIIAFHCR